MACLLNRAFLTGAAGLRGRAFAWGAALRAARRTGLAFRTGLADRAGRFLAETRGFLVFARRRAAGRRVLVRLCRAIANPLSSVDLGSLSTG